MYSLNRNSQILSLTQLVLLVDITFFKNIIVLIKQVVAYCIHCVWANIVRGACILALVQMKLCLM